MSQMLVRVVFVDAATGTQIGRSELPVAQLPESFQPQTTLELAGTTWSVERAEPPTAVQFAATGALALTLRRIEPVPTADILYSLPTICAVLPAAVDTSAGVDRVELHEDDWRQVEMVSTDLVDVVQAEMRAVRQSYERHVRRDDNGRVYGFQGIHVRTEPIRPLSAAVSRRRLLGTLPPAVRDRGGIAFRRQRGVVPSSFVVAIGRVLLYGLADGDTVAVLALHTAPGLTPEPSPGLVTGLEKAMRSANLMLVDWCRATVVSPASIGDYLVATGAVPHPRRA